MPSAEKVIVTRGVDSFSTSFGGTFDPLNHFRYFWWTLAFVCWPGPKKGQSNKIAFDADAEWLAPELCRGWPSLGRPCWSSGRRRRRTPPRTPRASRWKWGGLKLSWIWGIWTIWGGRRFMSKGASAKVICGRFESKEVWGLQEEIVCFTSSVDKVVDKGWSGPSKLELEPV